MSDSEDDDLPREKVKKTLLGFGDRQSSKTKLNYKGVKSYLHQFYEYTKDPNAATGTDGEFLLKSRHVRVRSIYWRVILVSGLLLMILGLFAVLLSYLLPRRTELVYADELEGIKDESAEVFNNNLDNLKLLGLATFCIGGICSSMALLLASCCFRRCNAMDFKHDDAGEPGKMAKKLVQEGDADLDAPPLSPVDVKIPGQESLFVVQPVSESGVDGATAYPIPTISTSTAL